MEAITPPAMNHQNTILSQWEICGGTGWIMDVSGDEPIARPCKCYKQKLRNNKIRFANIPETYKNIRLNNYKTDIYKDDKFNKSASAIKNVVVNYLKNIEEFKESGIGIYLFSQKKGSGKTLLATAIANEMINEKNMVVKFVTGLDIVNEIKATWDKNNDQELNTEYKLMNYLKTTEVLVIDDFGTETFKDWYDDKFYEIINTRYSNKLITIYTSNCSIDQLRYEEQIKNRIKERTYGIHMPEVSIREFIAEERKEELRRLSNE